MDLTVLCILLFLLVVAAVAAVMVRDLLKATIALAVMSVVLTIILYLMKSPLAAVFELSVCAGLITVVFISAISLTKAHSREEVVEKVKERRQRFIHLPFLLVALGIVLWFALSSLDLNWLVCSASSTITFQETLWNTRQLEVLGQIIIVLAGVFGVIVLFKERDSK